MPSRRLQHTIRRTFSVIAVILIGTTITAPAYAQPSPPPGGESDLRRQYEDLAAQAAALDEDLLKAKDDLAAREAELAKTDADLAQSMQTLQQAQASQQQFQGTVDQFTSASYQGARLHRMSALMGSASADEFLDRMSALNVLATDTRAALDGYTGAVNTAGAARGTAEAAQRTADEATAAAAQLASDIQQAKTDLDSKITEVRAALNRLSPADRADLSRVKDNGVYLGPPGAAGVALQAALDKRGSEYEWAGVGPTEFDCSGLTMWAYNAAGIKLPHSSRSQYTLGRAVSTSELVPGDLLFYDDGTGNPARIHHVGMYVGDGKMVDAPTEGQLVDVRPMRGDGHFIGARRIVG